MCGIVISIGECIFGGCFLDLLYSYQYLWWLFSGLVV